MSGERIDYGIERQRHEGFVGRETLLDRLDELLTADGADRWVVVTGGPGMGKSALLAAWLARRERAGAVVPHHFIRRGQYDWDDPAKLVSSLVAQLEERHPGVREPEGDVRIHPAARLAAMLARVSASDPARPGERLVILIDGLDEYDPPAGAAAVDPLAAFLPHALPRGVSFLCASRPRHPYVDRLAERDGELVQLDLDEPDSAADNAATVRAFWERAAPALGLDARFVDEAVARAGGNLQHAATLRKQLAALPAGQRRAVDIPRGLAALIAKSWQRVAADPIAVVGLGILCAARGALTLDELGAVAGWTDEAQRQAFVRGARELLVETRRADDVPEYRLHHDSIRAQVAGAIGAAALRGHHDALARKLATWPPPVGATARRYALQHALLHRAEAGTWTDAWRLSADMGFLEAKCRELGAHDAEADVSRAAERCRASGDEAFRGRFDDLARAIGRESHWLRAAPEATAALVWNRLRQSGWSADEVDQQLQLPAGASFLRVRHLATRESPALVRDLVGHAGSVLGCAVTADGRRVVSGSRDNMLKVWDLETGRAVATLEGHASDVTACAVTPDGQRVVSGSWDNTLKVWDLETGCVVATLEGHALGVNACVVTPDGRRVVSGSNDGTLKVWDVETGRAVTTLEGHAERVNACAVTPDGRRVVSGCDDGTLKVWDVETGRAMATLEGHGDRVNACAVTPDGRRVVSGSDDNTLKVWDLETGRAVATLEGHGDRVTACAVTPDGRRVVSASDDNTLKVWSLETGRALATLEGHAARMNACAVTPDGRRVVSGSWDNTLKVWNLETGCAVTTLEGHAERVTSCAVTPDGRRLVSGSYDDKLKIWDLETGRAVATLEGHASWVTSCAVTPDSRRVVSGSWDNTLKVWDLETGRGVATLEGHASWVTSCAVTPDGRRVVSGSWDNTLKVWDLETGRAVATLEGHASWVTSCAVTPDGRRVVSGSDDGTLKVWDVETGRAVATLEGHAEKVTACAVTPDGRRVVSGSDDGTLKVWDVETGRAVATLEGHAEKVTACAVTPDSRRVVSGSWDNTLKVWDLETYVCLLTHRANSTYFAVTATATTIIAGDAVGAVWFLDWPSPNRRESSNHRDRAPDHQRSTSPGTEPPSQRLPMKHTILFLAANPLGTDRLALDEECAAIERELRMTSGRDDFDFRSKWAVSVDELMRHLNELQPAILHFSGHGSTSTAGSAHAQGDPHRDVKTPRGAGIFLQDEGRSQYVSERALAKVIKSASPSTRVVVLNACSSASVAESLRHVVDCVVGMDGAIADTVARSFAVAFYRALGNRRSVGNAVDQAVATLAAKQLPDNLPVCRTRDGLTADQIFLPTSGDRPDPVEHPASRAGATTAPAPQPSRPGASTAAPPRVDIGILTIRDDEFRAVLDVFPSKAGIRKGKSREYTLRHADVGNGERYTVAVSRLVEQGHGEAQDAARDLLDDLAPRLVLVVGIAGGLPSEVKLGDVVISTRIHDFTVEARKTGQEATYAATGGPVAKALASAIANLASREDEMGDWTDGLLSQPAVAWTEEGQVYGLPEWQRELRDKLKHHYGEGSTPRAPRYFAGPIASSDRLVKDPALLIPWLTTARDLLAVEMESGGVYRAVRERCPMLAIRGISDIVGLSRADAWTKFACASAAAFTRAFLRTRPVEVSSADKTPEEIRKLSSP